ncbi:MAG: hypothetical protein WDW38_000402 [Sanguina aurantia]
MNDNTENGVKAADAAVFDTDLYGGSDKGGYERTLVDEEDEEEERDNSGTQRPDQPDGKRARVGLSADDVPDPDAGGGMQQPKTIYEREDDYRRKRLNRIISPDRNDAFAMGDKTPDARVRTYADIMKEQQLQREMDNTMKNIADKKKAEAEAAKAGVLPAAGAADGKTAAAAGQKRRNRWDQSGDTKGGAKPASDWDMADATPVTGSRWDATPGGGVSETPGHRNRWDDATPAKDGSATPAWGGETPAAGAEGKPARSRWDMTPAVGATPMAGGGVTPGFYTGATPAGMSGMETPSTAARMGQVPATPEQYYEMRLQKELNERNRPLTDQELDSMLPDEKGGYKIQAPPAGYQPIVDPARKAMETPGSVGTPFYTIPEDNPMMHMDMPRVPEGMPELKPEDMQYFSKLLQAELSADDAKERRIMKLLLKVKNGTPPQRKAALRHLTDKARELGAKPLLDAILPLLMQPTLEDQERHLLVKVIDRILYKLDELVRPFVHKILVVIQPMLIDEDYYARVEGREIVANLSKAAGLAQMIAAMRPDLDNIDEYIRNTTARAFSVVASALGIPALLPFLKAVCQSKKSWQARHTGIKICQQIAILMGCAVLPHLKSMVDIIKHGLKDENQKVKTITALSLAALAEAATPYGIESFDDVLEPLWRGSARCAARSLRPS